MLKFPKLTPDWAIVVVVALIALVVGIKVGMMLSAWDVQDAYESGRKAGEYDGYWRAQAQHGIY